MAQLFESVMLALASIWANKLRSVLTLLGNIVAVSSIITVVAQVYLASTFGSAAFVQPGIGRAYLRGETAAAQALNADTAYGPALIATAAFSVLLWLIGTVFLAVALIRTSPRLRVACILYAVSVPLFIWSGQVDLIPLQQALAGLLLTVATVLIALRLPKGAS